MIQGSRVVLRTFEEDDLAEYSEIVNNLNHMSPYWPANMKPTNILKNEFDESGFWKSDYKLLLLTDNEGNLIGELDAFKTSPNLKGPEIGFRIFKPENYGKGFMTEALQLFSAYLFQTDSTILRLTLLIHSGNAASLRVAEKCGYKREGTLRNAWPDCTDGTPHSDEILSLLRNESPTLEELLHNPGGDPKA